MSAAVNDETAVIRRRARVTATFSRRSPPSCVQRAEAVDHLAVGALAVADGEDDRVAFVALDALEVLDEEPLGLVLVEELVEVGAVAQRVAQRAVDAVGVLDAHRDDAEALFGSLFGVLEDQLDDLEDLGVAAVLAGGLIRAATGRARDAGTPGR